VESNLRDKRMAQVDQDDDGWLEEDELIVPTEQPTGNNVQPQALQNEPAVPRLTKQQQQQPPGIAKKGAKLAKKLTKKQQQQQQQRFQALQENENEDEDNNAPNRNQNNQRNRRANANEDENENEGDAEEDDEDFEEDEDLPAGQPRRKTTEKKGGINYTAVGIMILFILPVVVGLAMQVRVFLFFALFLCFLVFRHEIALTTMPSYRLLISCIQKPLKPDVFEIKWCVAMRLRTLRRCQKCTNSWRNMKVVNIFSLLNYAINMPKSLNVIFNHIIIVDVERNF